MRKCNSCDDVLVVGENTHQSRLNTKNYKCNKCYRLHYIGDRPNKKKGRKLGTPNPHYRFQNKIYIYFSRNC